MEKKIYEKPVLISVIDLDDEICDIEGETRIRINNPDGTRFDGWGTTQETDDPGFWDDWNYAKKSTIWDDEEEEY